ncbi:hypothetical protein [Streptomyces narbonensis]
MRANPQASADGPGGSPAFLGPDGKVLGEPSVAVDPSRRPKPVD